MPPNLAISVLPTPRSVGRHPSAVGNNRTFGPSNTEAHSLSSLTSLERQAVLVGLSDARHRRRISGAGGEGLLRLLFGPAGVSPLANPHLEALQIGRASCSATRRPHVSSPEVPRSS